ANHIGLARQVSGEKQAGSHPVLVQVGQQIQARDGRVVAQRDGKAEPGRVGVLGGAGQEEEFLAVLQLCVQVGEVAPALLHELRRLVQLRQAAGGLHVGDLEVVAQVAVGVLVVVARGQAAQ